uniref:Uncharacterized protein n=1 Tax=Branchiostoma floridae TaxID=7739 RepID=C3XT04_BRAFL|eukprot:XP_002612728.1 hypothetical protein BRAFLDRAFT_97293 [Branchiostoma floridae]
MHAFNVAHLEKLEKAKAAASAAQARLEGALQKVLRLYPCVRAATSQSRKDKVQQRKKVQLRAGHTTCPACRTRIDNSRVRELRLVNKFLGETELRCTNGGSPNTMSTRKFVLMKDRFFDCLNVKNTESKIPVIYAYRDVLDDRFMMTITKSGKKKHTFTSEEKILHLKEVVMKNVSEITDVELDSEDEDQEGANWLRCDQSFRTHRQASTHTLVIQRRLFYSDLAEAHSACNVVANTKATRSRIIRGSPKWWTTRPAAGASSAATGCKVSVYPVSNKHHSKHSASSQGFSRHRIQVYCWHNS